MIAALVEIVQKCRPAGVKSKCGVLNDALNFPQHPYSGRRRTRQARADPLEITARPPARCDGAVGSRKQ